MRKNFYITNEAVLKKLASVDNKSKYITNLILKDIEQSQKISLIDKNEIIKIVQEYLGVKNNKEEIDPKLQQSISSILNI